MSLSQPLLDASVLLEPAPGLGADAAAAGVFSELIVDALTQGPMTREALKARCRAAGMTEAEEASMFHPWGGGIRELCERSFLCAAVSEEKIYQLCPPFTPMEEADALLEQTRRYFTGFGPASVRDAAYYFGTTQTEIKKRISQLPLEVMEADEQRQAAACHAVPSVFIGRT